MTLRAFQCFAAGAHTDMRGRKAVYSESDVTTMAVAYDPARYAAPLVLGHPDDDRAVTSYGEAKGLTAHGGKLFAIADVKDALLGMVRKGSYSAVSASFFLPQAKSNPVPGAYYLKHIGFLGAVAPAVKGMQPLAFALPDDFESVILPVSFSAPCLTAAQRRSANLQRITTDLRRACPGMPLMKAARHAERFI